MTSIIQNSSPVDVVKALIASIRTKDIESMGKIIHPKATACLIREGEPRFQTLAEAIDTLDKSEHEIEEVTSDEVDHIDGEYATVWAKFRIHRDGEASVSFCSQFSATFPANQVSQLLQLGSSTYSCWKSPLSGWIILTMSDIARSPTDTVRV